MELRVTVKKRPLKGGRFSLYLNISKPVISRKTGKLSRKEFLERYISEPISYKKKKTNAGIITVPVYTPEDSNTLRCAEEASRIRESELKKPEIYSKFEFEQWQKNEKDNKNFVEYFKNMADEKNGTNKDIWIATFKYLNKFTSGTLRFGDLNVNFCEKFKNYLLTTKSLRRNKVALSENSCSTYFNKFKVALKKAYVDELLSTDINPRIRRIKYEDPHKDFLSLEELNKLMHTECHCPLLKKAAVFSALSGLRFSDIKKLTWSEVNISKEMGPHLILKQKKTKEDVMLPISRQAFDLLGTQGITGEKVFNGLEYSAYSNKHLYQWIRAAGISKKITFHCFRHTYATLQHSHGTDLYTLSSLLGHKRIKTTQIYAHVVNKLKREAADRIILDI